MTSNSPVAVNVERPTATADCKIQYSGNMSFRFGTTTRFKVIKVTKVTKTTWTQACLTWYRAIQLADIQLVSEKLLCAYSLRLLINWELTEAHPFAFDLDSSRVDPSIDQEETPAGDDVQIASERISRGVTTAEQSSLFDGNGHSVQDNLNLGPNQYLGEEPTELDVSGIEALRNTPEELFLLRHYSECIAPWYCFFAIHCMITS